MGGRGEVSNERIQISEAWKEGAATPEAGKGGGGGVSSNYCNR